MYRVTFNRAHEEPRQIATATGTRNAKGQNMSIKFNDTQLVLLSAASLRDDHCLVPPAGIVRVISNGSLDRYIRTPAKAGLMPTAG